MTSAPADDLVAALARRGLGTPTRILFEAHRPIAPLLGDAAEFLSPILAPLGLRSFVALLADPDATVRRLDALGRRPDPDPRAESTDGAAECLTSER